MAASVRRLGTRGGKRLCIVTMVSMRMRGVVRCCGSTLQGRLDPRSRGVADSVRRVLVIRPVRKKVPARQHDRYERIQQERDCGAP